MKTLITITALLFSVMIIKAQKVYSVDYESQAGWKNNSKKQLMY